MQISLHNKYEITIGDSNYTAYNTITHNIYDQIKTLSEYGKYFAFGNGIGDINYNSNSMINRIATYDSQIEEYNIDPTKGTLYIKRCASIDENSLSGLSFTEIGLGVINKDDGKIVSHVKILNQSGEQVSIVKKPGQTMFVRATIYLEIDESKKYLTAGDNLLIKAILGAAGSSEHVLKATRGYNLVDNTDSIYRNIPRDADLFDCTLTATTNQDNSTELNFSYDLSNGETPEIILLLDGSPVCRYRVSSNNSTTDLEVLTSQTNNTLDLGKFVTAASISKDSQTVDQCKFNLYAKEFSDYIANPFDANITASTTRFVSKDSSKVAFIADGTVYIYLNQAYQLKQIANNISSTNIKNIIMFEDNIFVIYSVSPYIKVYKIENMTAVEKSVDFSVYENFDNSYDWQDVHIINDNNGNFTLGIILNEINHNPVIVKAKFIDNIFTVISATSGKSDYIVNMFSLYKNNFCSSMIGFITNNYNSPSPYKIEQVWADGTTEITNEVFAYLMVNDTAKLEGKSRAVIAKKPAKPYIWLFYYPRVFRYSISLTEGVENWVSTSLKYLIQKYQDQSPKYKIYSLTNYDNPEEFVNGFPSDIDLNDVTDFEFLDDTLLIFSASSVKAINLKQIYTIAENLPEANAEYDCTISREVIYGSSNEEGVQGSVKVVFTVWYLPKD